MIEKIVVARNKKYGISNKGKIPWCVKEDLEHFKKETINQVVVMGKGTYLDLCNRFNTTLGDRALSGRFNVVISKTLKSSGLVNKAGIAFFNTISDFRKYIKQNEIKTKLYKSGVSEIIYIGGESIYSEALNYITELVVTEIPNNLEVDRFFMFDKSIWKLNSVTTVSNNGDLSACVIRYSKVK